MAREAYAIRHRIQGTYLSLDRDAMTNDMLRPKGSWNVLYPTMLDANRALDGRARRGLPNDGLEIVKYEPLPVAGQVSPPLRGTETDRMNSVVKLVLVFLLGLWLGCIILV